MSSIRSLILLVALASFCAAQSEPTIFPVRVSIFYSVYCENCRGFLTGKFAPFYDTFKSWIDLDLIPFGNSTDLGGFEFSCPEGTDECIANKWHTCTDRIYKGRYPKEVAAFVNCTLWRDDGFFEDVQKCAEENYLTFLPIQHCVNELEGKIHLAANAARTKNHEPAITSYPTIEFNGTYDQELHDLAVKDFKAAICSQLKDPQTGAGPKACNFGTMITPFLSVLLLSLWILLKL
ncbi:GILT-like protein 1 [Neocloeon triangulifer]|uniref:GILT-like protein 1 n=1 Tax=Neocloeon triangulifer TaxID=2078957 RepID=UPI00286F6335|nr:GILT-like protein 1 [Neocloeon triangulifer]